LRVVHLGKYYPPAAGGIESHTQTLARGQAALGADVRVLVVNHADGRGADVTFAPFARTADAADRDGPVRVERVGRVACVAKLDLAPGLPRAFRRLLADPPDVWHLHTPNVTLMLAVAADRRVRPLVVTHHSDVVRQKVLRHGLRALERVVYGRAAAVLPTSCRYAEASAPLAPFRDKIEPLPLGIDLRPFQKPSAAALEHADRVRRGHPGPVWVSVGRLVYYKAVDVALHALRELPGTLMVIGTGPRAGDWRRLAADLGVADRVVWRGRADADELVGTLLAATALLFTGNARSEAFGLAQVEAMACGLPVVNCDIPGSGVPWVSRHGETGLTVPIDDPAAVAAACRRLLAEPGLRDRLAAEGRRQAAGRFDARVMAERSLAVYRRVLGRAA
jgi:rhamnosyl/mannosyltransferase